MKESEQFSQFAEGIYNSLKNVPFKELNGYEGRHYTWKKGRKAGVISIAVEIVSAEYKRVTVEGVLPGKIFKQQGYPYRRIFRAYESGVRVPELQD